MFRFSTNAFADGVTIPKKYTCDGEDISPFLEWQNPPKDTKSFVIIMDDPDAPMGTFVHWVVANIPANTTSLTNILPEGSVEGQNSINRIGWTAPCPPSGMAFKISTEARFFILFLYLLDL